MELDDVASSTIVIAVGNVALENAIEQNLQIVEVVHLHELFLTSYVERNGTIKKAVQVEDVDKIIAINIS